MKFCALAFISLLTSAHGQVQDCSGQGNRFRAPSDQGRCTNWESKVNIPYPQGFDGIFNQVETYTCPESKKRIIISNNIPDHDVVIWRTKNPCEVLSVVEIPLDPPNPDLNAPKTEVPIRGMIAIAKNGVPAFGPQESDSLNAVDPTESNKVDAGYWYGHPGGNNGWHVHNPQMGTKVVNSETFLGYSMDGYKIYGPLDDDVVESTLDECNGRFNDDNIYQYHVRTLNQVDKNADYCDGTSPVTKWNYVLGCYSGDISQSRLVSQKDYELPSDCVLESHGSCTDNPDFLLDDTPGKTCEWIAQQPEQDRLDFCELHSVETECPSTCGYLGCASQEDNIFVDDGPTEPVGELNPTKRPNVIIIQPDDLIFMDKWGRPPHTGPDNVMPGYGEDMPYIEDLRTGGLQMLQAYASSPMCGTSRYSTITGKMPSRSQSIRRGYDEAINGFPAAVTIPSTKLINSDCSAENLAAAFGADPEYETGMFGKWHLSRIKDADYTYQHATDEVKKCGFNTVGALYIENLKANEDEFNNYSDGSFSHNMEWLTHEAIKFINTTVDSGQNFFMYFNPTVPHASNSVKDAIDLFSCKATADPDQSWVDDKDPWIKGMSEDEGCEAYRQTIHDRAMGVEDSLGQIWLDDAIGALVNALIDNGIYDDTIIVFQEDHGMDTKEAMYEGGVRIPQFVHYPAGIHPGTFNAPVSNVDLAPTLMEYAGISPSYETDGSSWKEAVEDNALEESWRNERCLFFEMDNDRAVRCGCYKYMDIELPSGGTYDAGLKHHLANDLGGILFDLCDGGDNYITDGELAEKNAVVDDMKKSELASTLNCHIENTDPRLNADYSACYDASYHTPSPTDSPTTAPSASPTAAPVACTDDPYFRFGALDRDCVWLSGQQDPELSDICNRRAPDRSKLISDYCQVTCARC